MKTYSMKFWQSMFLAIFINTSFAQGFMIEPRAEHCIGDRLIFTDTSTHGVGKVPIRWTWDMGDGTTQVTFNNKLFYTYTATNTVGITPSLVVLYNDGTSTATIYSASLVKIHSKPTASFTTNTNTTCPGVNISFNPTPTAGSSGVISYYNIDFGDGTSINPFNALSLKNYSLPGIYTATMTIRDIAGCQVQSSQQIRILRPIKPKIELADKACRNQNTVYSNLSPNKDQPIYSWQWNFIDSDGTLTQNTTINPGDFVRIWPNAGFKQVFLRMTEISTGCNDTSNNLIHNVDTLAKLDIEPSNDTTLCLGESIDLTIRGTGINSIVDFTWGERISGDSIVRFSPKNTITYTIQSKTPNCPATTKSYNIRVIKPALPVITANPTKTLIGTPVELSVNSESIWDSLVWHPEDKFACTDCETTVYTPTATGYVTAEMFFVEGDRMCSSRDSVLVTISTQCTKDLITMPTAFTPDGSNDLNKTFYPMGYELESITEFNVFNRWGNPVYKKSNISPNDPASGWNGQLDNKGEDLPSGSYYYTVVGQCTNKQTINFHGEVVLIR